MPVLGLDPEDSPAARHERPLVQVARVEVHAAATKLLKIWKELGYFFLPNLDDFKKH